MPKNWEERAKKVEKRKNGMRRSGDSVFVVRDSQRKRDQRTIEGREKKTARFWTA